MTTGTKSKFEQELNTYFPELADLYALMKQDKRVWVVIKAMLQMANIKQYGKVVITYQDGKINMVSKTVRIKD